MRQIAAIVILLMSAVTAASADVQSPADLSSAGCQTQETSLGDLMADAVRASANTQIALIPAGGLREITIPKGNIKTADVLKCLQYPDDQIAVMRLTGAQLLKALERSVSIYPQRNMGFLQVSGLTLTFNAGAAKDSRIESVSVGGEQLSPDQSYRVATPEPLADGAYGYFTIWGNEYRQMRDKTIAQAATDFLSQRTSVDYRVLNRITSR